MKYKVLLTIDLPGATEEQRVLFYGSLNDAGWEKMDKITTVWKATFKEGTIYSRAKEIAIDCLKNAKKSSKVAKVSYNFLISWYDIQSGTL